MPIPDYQSLMRPVLIAASKGEISTGDCVGRISEEFGLTDEERQVLLRSGKQSLIANRTHWAKTYLVKAGLLQITRRGYFQITDRGQAVLKEYPDRVDNTVLSKFPEFRAFVVSDRSTSVAPEKHTSSVSVTAEAPVKSDSEPPPSDRTPAEIMADSHEEITQALAQELIDRILAAPPAFFERLVVDVLVAMGYGGSREDAGRAIGKSGDGGIDGVIDQDPLGLDRVYVQAKRYQPESKVGRPEVQAFSGSLDGVQATKGVFVTTSSFAGPALDFAGRIAKRIILIDGVQLANLMIRYNVGVRAEQVFEVKKADEDYFVI